MWFATVVIAPERDIAFLLALRNLPQALSISRPVVRRRDEAAYAPVTILVDERADGVHLSYGSMASLLTPYGSQSALSVALDLDAKMERLLKTAAG